MSNALKLYIALSRAYRAILAHDEQDVRCYGLNLTEFAVLELLYHKGPHPLQQIGEKILITTGTITYVVDKLEKKGLLRRQISVADKRITYAVLTETGEELLSDVFPGHAAALEYALGGLSPQEQAAAASLLKKLGYAAAERLRTTDRKQPKIKEE